LAGGYLSILYAKIAKNFALRSGCMDMLAMGILRIIVLVCVSWVWLFAGISVQAHGEVDALLKFKAMVKDPLNSLSDWKKNDSSPCTWTGITCESQLQRPVVAINLHGKNLSGTLSPAIAGLQALRVLNLSSNNFSGSVPVELLNCSSLRKLILRGNSFSGAIPVGLSGLKMLEVLDLYNNMISGVIPSDIGLYPRLSYLDLGGNCIEGTIPPQIFNLTSLIYLTLAGNELTGKIPSGFKKLQRLEWLYLGYNQLVGEIPSEIGEIASLSHLDLVYNNLTGEIPYSIGNLTNLEELFLYQNKLSGSIPMSIYNLTKLVSLDFSDNALNGEVDEMILNLQNLQVLNLFSNKLTGRIPSSLASLPQLDILALWANRFRGNIPAALGTRNNLSALDLSGNLLHGSIPAGLCNSKRLYKLILFKNFLSGPIPESLANCQSLRRVRLEENYLSGDFPVGFTQLPLVYYLDISSNNLSGSVDRISWRMPSLQMLQLQRNQLTGKLPPSMGKLRKLETLDLSSNRFSGQIPSEMGELAELTQLHLSGNLLEGRIPEEIGNCLKLVDIDLSNNRLVGEIPEKIASMPVLGSLDVSSNFLTGKVPADLGSVESLVFVNISHNDLHGPLPPTGAFVEINSTAVDGNDGVCGVSPGVKKCPDLNWSPGLDASIAVSVLAFVAICSAFIYGTLRLRSRSQQLKKVESAEVSSPDCGSHALELVSFNKKHPFSVEEVIHAMKEENVISKGSSGTVYRGFTKKGKMLAVKELAFGFDPDHIQYLCKLHHPHVVKLLGYCKNATGTGLLIVHEYMEKGSLHGHLHEGVGFKNLDWRRRLKIVSGTAKALAYLHHECSPGILHGNVTSSKILLDADYGAHLSPNIKFSAGPSASSKDSKGYLSSGYVAPEYIYAKEFTEKTDVYSFGVFLIELLTGRRPIEPEFGEHASIVDWAHALYGDWDCNRLIDPVLSESIPVYQAEMMRVMNLSIRCTSVSPALRPTMREVVQILKTVRKPVIGLGCS
jgi:Leucine-rich repeat (LRR) protein